MSAIEVALWDIAGKVARVPIYKLLGGKIRDKVRVYNGNIRFPLDGYQPEDFAANMKKMKDLPENFSIIKQEIAFHGSPPSDARLLGGAVRDGVGEYYRQVWRRNGRYSVTSTATGLQDRLRIVGPTILHMQKFIRGLLTGPVLRTCSDGHSAT